MNKRFQKTKLAFALTFAFAAIVACTKPGQKRYVVAASNAYEASLFRQNCAICHGPEAEGRTLSDGSVVPNLRQGDFKYKSDAQIYQHIAEGGNGMVPFRNRLTDREIRQLVDFVQRDLRNAR